jgi:GR25 family glycosyltransferase involved in LPS biosynthesis
MEYCDFYCLSFNNKERKEAMEERFNKLGISAFIYSGVSYNDPRIKDSKEDKRILSFTYGHLDLINEFYFKSDKEYGIICEDDIIIRKDFTEKLPTIVKNFKDMKLDLLLLGCLLNCSIQEDKMEENNYYRYDDNIWGAQMYMITKKQAFYLIKKFSYPYCEKHKSKPFNSDWIFTKEGNRALIYPLMAIEDGKSKYEDQGQQVFHDECHRFNYIPDLFI